jgi:hypothetical protein
MRPVKAAHLLNTVQLVSGRRVVTVSVGPKYDPVVLSLSKEIDSDNSDKCVNRYYIHHQTEDGYKLTTLNDTSEEFHFLQPLKKDLWLLVRSSADSELDKNAHIYSKDGRLIYSFHVGDGIEDVQTTVCGQIWISYFDEGVFSDLDFGSSGVVCLDENGNIIYKFSEFAQREQLPFMMDCYAMKVSSNDEVWLYYYSDSLPL